MIVDPPFQMLARLAGRPRWTVTYTIGINGQHSAAFDLVDGHHLSLPVSTAIEYSAPFTGSSHTEWHREFTRMVNVERPATDQPTESGSSEDSRPDPSDSRGSNGHLPRWSRFPR